jgi:membrane protein implicated in regulation of membrane protease activity
MIDGALWQAETAAPIAKGSRVRVRAVKGLHLEVEPSANPI